RPRDRRGDGPRGRRRRARRLPSRRGAASARADRARTDGPPRHDEPRARRCRQPASAHRGRGMKALEAPLDPAQRRFLPAARLVPSSQRTRTAARNLTVAFALFVLFLALAPWRQNLPGTGQVIAYTPDDRPQTIAATIAGRVLRWHVIEGQSVEAGGLLVQVGDNEPLPRAPPGAERAAAHRRRAGLPGEGRAAPG